MKISEDKLQKMFSAAGVDKSQLYGALVKLGPKHLKEAQMRKDWDPNNPTKNYCYLIAEFVANYFSPNGYKGMKVMVPGDPYGHRYVLWPDNTIIDLAVEQFDNYEEVDYSKGTYAGFLFTPSKRCKLLKEIYETV
jgi:hypothetical protein